MMVFTVLQTTPAARVYQFVVLFLSLMFRRWMETVAKAPALLDLMER